MPGDTLGGGTDMQTGTQGANDAGTPAAVHPGVPLLLLDRHQAAQALGVSTRTFEELMDEPWMSKPVQLGPRLLRWPLVELQQAIANMPRRVGKQQPVRERIARLKGEGTPS
jgi:predicted DNA-binding transcriptional regulator AlpA